MKGVFEIIEKFRVTLKAPAFRMERVQRTEQLALTFSEFKICTAHAARQRVKTGTLK